MSACVCSTRTLPTTYIEVHDKVLLVEVAANPSTRACGLASRDELPWNHGMLFVLPEPTDLQFWMGDTSIPLSIAFLDGEGRILDIMDMQPSQRRERYASSLPALYAIEVNQGWFQEQHIAEGEVIRIDLPPDVQVR